MKKFAVIGLGNFGFHVAKALYEDGNEVIAIDTEKSRVQAIGEFASEAIVMDSTDKEALKSLGLETMDAVIVSTGTKISTSVLICLHLQEMKVRKILAKALDKELVPENFILVPPPTFVVKDSDILIMLGKTENIKKMKALAVG